MIISIIFVKNGNMLYNTFKLIAYIPGVILIFMMVLCTQVNKMYVIATLSVYPHRASLKKYAWPRRLATDLTA